MNQKILGFLLISFVSSGLCLAQTAPSNEDFKVSATTQQGKQYPQVNSQGKVRVQIAAPDASKVQLDLGGKNTI